MDDHLRRELEQLAIALDGRVEVWRVIIDADGTEISRRYRGSYTQCTPGNDASRRTGNSNDRTNSRT